MYPFAHDDAFYDASGSSGAVYPSASTDAAVVPAYIAPALITAPSTSPDHTASAAGEPHRRARVRHTSPLAPYPTPSSEPHSVNDELIISKRRNVQVSLPSSSSTTPNQSTPAQRDRWKCPHCPHVQQNRRGPDLRRHIATHTRPAQTPQWVCCGVPVFEAVEHGVPEKLVKAGEVWQFEGMFMVGGCKKTFSRRDAYRRHLKRETGRCFGDPHGLYQPGNVRDEDSTSC
ncbi:hypothetical protein L226DRAFT_539713 [Lentinus tigrinus ALCF2SS1-7]|uniref:Uncharacterized protein n=1 Tax=Lentinus tigrinus ALCF2SS1-6 TaxID=1328759 RepID=A0A5C2S975_9APHY|nr:hypothetical protein L227DRAFT_575345 [Lentinus tigrinus ALCF2SS1-6]RPD69535.1 hypothetical protein L226DRAFT_539713 [Lentinus tigrinus ALCF2SS1-7]